MKIKKKNNNNPKPVGNCKNSARGRFIAIQAYLKKQKSQINNVKQLEKK